MIDFITLSMQYGMLIFAGKIGWILLCILIGAITYYKQALDFTGVLSLIIMGSTIIFFAGPQWLIVVILFLALTLVATKMAKPYKQKKNLYQKKRTAKNVLSNGLVAFILAMLGQWGAFVGGFIGAVATATADTMASEVGVLEPPILVTTLKRVPAGTNGGISITGTAVGMAGAGVIGIAACLLGLCPNPAKSLIIAIVAGTLGCFIDSFLGALLENKDLLSNGQVNFLATLSGAGIGALLMLLL